ncbi:ADP-ribosylation factor-binding protein GGA1 [Caenorhabditis elegans]|uniref:ADP-ribosylation factor-binding protein GGA1 n=1 Tax=Caenorhabditis elegans TaxID=6239 RepID=Q23165_CAEEL|nr:ADP-ribosylation factor-binding protein GGA1 [Caenorhabditis elegans]CAA92026.2 ADP-ribosylation factor-binding protein GGA1 [Caenorhabditis elegans]|eukprot:NP_509853.2 AdaPTin or adaptin-related protein [Caenorhabditis elegans]
MEEEPVRPIDYWVCRATDRFIGDEERIKALDFIIESIYKQPASALLAVDLFSHKLSSPSQEEAMLTIRALDYLVRNGGEKVHERCGRYKFLNELVRLIAPKYNGKLTSDALKTEIIKLLFIWQLSIKHIPKYKQVYESLKLSKIITDDPHVRETEVPVFAVPPVRSSVFDNEEQAVLLKALLSSNRPEDLETANNLIKTLVETEEHKLVKIHERRKKLDHAINLCNQVEHLRLDKAAETIGLGNYSPDNELTLQRVTNELIQLQELFYGYVNELAENNDPCLEEVLNINDQINRVLPENETPKCGNRAPISARTQLDPENQELLVFNTPTSEVPPKNGFCDPRDLEGSLLNNMIESEFVEEPKIVPVQQMTPVLNRNSSASPRASGDSSIFETDFLAGKRLPEPLKPPTLNELKPNTTTITLEALEVLVPPMSPEPTSLSPKAIPEKVALNPSSIIMRNRVPIEVLYSKGMRILLYYCQSDMTVSNIHSYVLVIQNHNNFTIKDVNLSLKTNDKNVIIRLQDSVNNLAGFNIFGQQETINLLLCIQQLNDVKDVELDFTLAYKKSLESAISGSFTLPIIPEHIFNINF